MYDHIRARLQSALDAREADSAAAASATTAAQTARDSATTAITTTQAALSDATQALTAAQGALATTTTDAQAKAAALASARADVADWMAERADMESTPGHPNVAWAKRLMQLQRVVTTAQQAATAAQAALSNANAAVAAATSNLQGRHGDLTSRQADLAAAEAQIASAQTASTTAAAGVSAAQAALAALDARTVRVGAPLDRGDLEAFADEEHVEVARLRHERASTRADRYVVIVRRNGILADHDGGIEALAALAQPMHQWTDTTLQGPPQVATALDTIVTSARAQRAADPRIDDLAGLATSVRAALDRLQADVAQATSRRDQTFAALQSAIADVEAVNEGAP